MYCTLWHEANAWPQVGSASPDVSTPSASTTVDTIRQLYGQTLAKELLHAAVSSAGGAPSKSTVDMDTSDGEDGANDDAEAWSAEARFTGASYQAKKMVLLLFINREWGCVLAVDGHT